MNLEFLAKWKGVYCIGEGMEFYETSEALSEDPDVGGNTRICEGYLECGVTICTSNCQYF